MARRLEEDTVKRIRGSTWCIALAVALVGGGESLAQEQPLVNNAGAEEESAEEQTSDAQAEETAAQPEAGDAAEAPKKDEVETIIVTSQKRSEDLQEVPAAVTVLSSKDIAESYSYTLENLQMLVPTLTFRKGTTTRNSALTLRGVGTISFSIAAEPSVSTVVDGVVMARSGQAFTDLYDLAQVEVMRGPQGTLFGKNASAGVINITTLGGTDELESIVSATAFEGEEYRLKASLSGPLSESVKGRITGFYGTFSGNITNVFDGAQINGYNRYGARGILEYQPIEDLKIKIIADYYKGNDDCCGEITGVSTNGDDGIDRDAIRGVSLDGIDTRSVNHNLVTRTIDETGGISLTADAYVGDHLLTGIFAFRRWDNTEIREGDFLPGVFLNENGSVFELHDTGVQSFNQYSAEIRLTSPQGKFIDYIAGLYFWRADAERSFTREDIVCSASLAETNPDFNAAPCFPGASTLTFPSSTAEMTSGFTNIGLFGQGTANFTDDLRLLVGARYIYDFVEFTHRRPAADVGGPGVRDVANDLSDSTDDNNVALKAAVQYDLMDDLMAYFSYSRGYKGPAFNVFYNMGPNNRLPIDPETSNSFELGVRSSLLNNKLNLNATGFFARYNNFQANNFVVIDGATTTTLTNAGDVQTLGAELDIVAVPFKWLRLIGGLAYTKATIVEFNTNPDSPPEEVDDRNGDPLPLAPELKLALNADINFPIDFGPFAVATTIRSQFSYTTRQFSDIGSAATGTRWPIDAYALWHASIGFSDPDFHHRLTFIVRNILDSSFVSLNTGAGTRLHIPRDADRYVGFNFTTSF